MAKFCTKCGRPLQDGEICNCQGQTNEQNNETFNNTVNSSETQATNSNDNVSFDYNYSTQNVANNQNAGYSYQQNDMQNGNYNYQQNNMQNGNYNYQQNNMQNPNYNYQQPYVRQNTFGSELVNTFVGIFSNTKTVTRNYVAQGDYRISFIFIALQAFITATLACVSVAKLFSYMSGLFSSMLGGLTRSLGGLSSRSSSMNVDVNYVLIFFVTFILSLIATFIFAAITLFVHKVIIGKNTSYTSELKLVSTRSIVYAIGRLLVIFAALVSLQVALLLYSTTTIWGVIMLITADDCSQCRNEKYKVMLWVAIFFVMLVVEYITLRIGTNMISDSLKESISGMYSSPKSSLFGF
ncbi:hypothetical protein [Lachnobacterium bovis]|uniref:Uncharacterized protein n=1 Tax=Lachnobacterium bovis TaxID=140626 RepID=A0A1H9P3L5_9FIRM|nr:hypothetical protein [Lachnobacterium bovis]SER42884.1 hypothetical protein SAMN02910429_00081 [Lachnobacterium bovis]